MQPILIHGKRSRYLTLLSVAACALGLGALLAFQGDASVRFYGWLIVVMQSLTLPGLIRATLLDGPRIVIDDRGIEDKLLRVGRIPWSDIAGAKLRTVNTLSYVSLQVHDPDKWLRLMPPLRRWVAGRNRNHGFSVLNLNLAATDGDPVQVWRLIQQRCEGPAAAESPLPPPRPLSVAHFPIRYSPRLSLVSAASNSFRLSGAGEIEFSGEAVQLRGRRNRIFGFSRRFSYAFKRGDAANLLRSGRMLHFDIEPPGAAPQAVTLWAGDDEGAQRIAAALPARTSEVAAQDATEIRTFQNRLDALGKTAWITPAIVGTNIAVFAAAAAHGAGLMTAHPQVLLKWGTNFAPYTMDGQWWRLLTATFLHFGLLHLLLNMWAMTVSGRLTERLYGGPLFLLIYFTAGLCGSLASLLWNANVNSAGASGAIFGVYGALLAFFLRKDTMVPATIVKQQRSSGLVFIFYNLIYGLGHHGIDNAAHVGGLLSGLALGFVLARPLDPARRATTAWRIPLGIGLAVALLGGGGLGAHHKAARLVPEWHFQKDITWLDDQRYKASELFATSRYEAHNGKLSDQSFAAQIESGPLPLYEAMQRRIQADVLPADSKLAPERRAYVTLIKNALDGCHLYVSGLRLHDPNAIDQAENRFNRALENSRTLERMQEDGSP